MLCEQLERRIMRIGCIGERQAGISEGAQGHENPRAVGPCVTHREGRCTVAVHGDHQTTLAACPPTYGLAKAPLAAILDDLGAQPSVRDLYGVPLGYLEGYPRSRSAVFLAVPDGSGVEWLQMKGFRHPQRFMH